jgi:hypothetical protein
MGGTQQKLERVVELGSEMEMRESTLSKMEIVERKDVNCIDSSWPVGTEVAMLTFRVDVQASSQNKFAAIRFLFATICSWR